MSVLTWLRVALIFLLIVCNTLVFGLPLILFAFLKALVPSTGIRRVLDPVLTGIAERWCAVNNWMITHFTDTEFKVSGGADLLVDGHYLMLANHQSWVDILVLQRLFNRRVPLMRFFLKKQLFWVPILGLAWWALDFPFMARYTPKQLAKRPHLAGSDVAATRKACEKFKHIPVTIMNFVEGTRFTEAKHANQQSPYRYLLKPKSGGVAFVLEAMGNGLQSILDVTIAYPNGRPGMFELMGNKIAEVRVHIRERAIPVELLGGDYQADREFRVRFQRWINELWVEKDAVMAGLLVAPVATSTATETV